MIQVLDDHYWNDYLAGSRSDIIASDLALEGDPLPDGFVTGIIQSAGDALRVVRATEPAWRIDVLEVIEDYLEQDE